jgi:Na+/H+ antiporter NhaD/arsenite permease-like protein
MRSMQGFLFFVYGKKQTRHPFYAHPICKPVPSREHKPQRMNTRTFFNRLIIFGFMVLVGYCLAKGIYHQSVISISLACISLCAGVYFLYLLAKAKQDAQANSMENEHAG